VYARYFRAMHLTPRMCSWEARPEPSIPFGDCHLYGPRLPADPDKPMPENLPHLITFATIYKKVGWL